MDHSVSVGNNFGLVKFDNFISFFCRNHDLTENSKEQKYVICVFGRRIILLLWESSKVC